MAVKEELPYRPCVGVMLLNQDRHVWIGLRISAPNDIEGDGRWWQMPQGGIDGDEDPKDASLRELYEETNIKSVRLLKESDHWYSYDFPEHLVGKLMKGRFKGQTQRWFAYEFIGDESEINVIQPGNGKFTAEFKDWRWVPMDQLTDTVTEFKRDVYSQVVNEFMEFSK